jgi:2-oxo-4-hydroxy-4-carboxy-5-ureidoimidazoline decarboxylase
MDTVDKVNNLSKSDFISIFGNVFEKTTWISEKTYKLKPFSNFEALQKSFLSVYDKCNDRQYLKIFNSHPQLAIEKIMTEHSKKEQAQSKLDICTNEELEEFVQLNHDYKKKFNFPFIIAVANLNKNEILNNFRQRINKNVSEELEEAKIQVKKIATLRLNQILKK